MTILLTTDDLIAIFAERLGVDLTKVSILPSYGEGIDDRSEEYGFFDGIIINVEKL